MINIIIIIIIIIIISLSECDSQLRTTPRALKDGTTRRQYVDTVIDTIRAFEEKVGSKMVVRLLLSVDRSGTLEDALETAQMAVDESKKNG